MDDHAGILQQRIQVLALLGGGNEPLERVRGEEDEEEEARGDEAHDAEHARDEPLGQVAAEDGDRERPSREHQHPQQDRAFVRAPRRREAVVRGQARVGVRRDVGDREIVGDERVGERREGGRDEKEKPRRDGPRRRH